MLTYVCYEFEISNLPVRKNMGTVRSSNLKHLYFCPINLYLNKSESVYNPPPSILSPNYRVAKSFFLKKCVDFQKKSIQFSKKKSLQSCTFKRNKTHFKNISQHCITPPPHSQPPLSPRHLLIRELES